MSNPYTHIPTSTVTGYDAPPARVWQEPGTDYAKREIVRQAARREGERLLSQGSSALIASMAGVGLAVVVVLFVLAGAIAFAGWWSE